MHSILFNLPRCRTIRFFLFQLFLSIEYWFRCMDLDGDGLLSMYELEYFYSEQVARMEEMGIEPISFEDCLCQCLDMVKPVLGDKIRLSDMKQCRLCHIFFDTFFNLPKYLQHEQRDPFSNLRVSMPLLPTIISSPYVLFHSIFSSSSFDSCKSYSQSGNHHSTTKRLKGSRFRLEFVLFLSSFR